MREKNKNYKRIDRQIIEAFVSIACRKSSTEMTVSELCKTANINHTTFYRHYRGLWQVHENILNEIYENVDKMLVKFDFEAFVKNPEQFYNSLNQSIRHDLELYKQLCRTIKIDSFLIELHGKLVQGIMNHIGLPEGPRKEKLLIKIIFLVSGTISTYRKWLLEEIVCPIEDISKEIAKMVQARILYEQESLKMK